MTEQREFGNGWKWDYVNRFSPFMTFGMRGLELLNMQKRAQLREALDELQEADRTRDAEVRP